MSNARKQGGLFGRLTRKVRPAASIEDETNSAQTTKQGAVAIAATPTSLAGSANELITQGLRQREQYGTVAALPFFERAAKLEPTSHLPFFMLGNAVAELGELDGAVRLYERARDLQPNNHVVRYNLGLNHYRRGYIQPAITELGIARQLNPSYLPAQTTYIMALHNSDRVSPEEIAATIREWGAQFALRHPASARSPRPAAAPPNQLRVGFISGDFRTHSVAHFFEPIASAHDHDEFAYILYNNCKHQDAVTERLRACADAWRDVWQLSDDALIQLIAADNIDILVDLSGLTEFNRLPVFARRAAPVQMTYLGYPDSTGLPTMDYRITDAITDPQPTATGWNIEVLLHLPNSQWCFRPFGKPTPPCPLPAREVGFVTFGSFNSLTKASDTMLNCWTRILGDLPTSRLRLTRVRSPQRAAEIVALFERSGVAGDRIECVSYRNDTPHGLQFPGVDIALDHYPYNGVTTTCESLYYGIPVISLHGRNCVSRSGLSILGSVGLSELVASTPQRYVEIALSLANDLERLEQLRAGLRARFEQSPLRNEQRFAANFEELLRTAWRLRCANS